MESFKREKSKEKKNIYLCSFFSEGFQSGLLVNDGL